MSTSPSSPSGRKDSEKKLRQKATQYILSDVVAPSGQEIAPLSPTVAKKENDLTARINPISNLPSSRDKGMPDTDRDFTVMRLRNEIAQLLYTQEELLAKLTYAQEILQSEKRFFELGMLYDQWETYDQIQKRRLMIKSGIDAISDPNASCKRLYVTPEERKTQRR